MPAMRPPTAHCRHIGLGGAWVGRLQSTASTAGLLTLYLKLEAGNGAGRALCFARHYWA